MFIDADTHVDECADTWSYFPESMASMRPAEMQFCEGQQPEYVARHKRGPILGLFIDGHIYERRVRNDQLTQTTVETRELYDVPARLKDMDRLGVDVQVIYPSTLLEEVTRRPELEIPICESYNRWLADRCSDTNGRLRWNAILPLRSMPDALCEMRRVKEAGAVGIFKRAYETDDRRAGDEYFHPMYELAQELDLPICIHVSTPYTGTTPAYTKTENGLERFLYLQNAFLSILKSDVCEKFRSLRIGFIEAASGWIPFLLWTTRYDTLTAQRRGERAAVVDTFESFLEESRLFVTCEAVEDLPDIIGRVGDTNLMVGSDYSHSDRSSVLMAHQEVMDRTDLNSETARKLTQFNAQRFYGLG